MPPDTAHVSFKHLFFLNSLWLYKSTYMVMDVPCLLIGKNPNRRIPVANINETAPIQFLLISSNIALKCLPVLFS